MGEPIEVYEGAFPEANGDTRGDIAQGKLAYSGWWNDTGHDRAHGHDFALIEILIDDKHKVHPAVRHWGGPTEIRPSNDLTTGERILWLGSSGLYRQQLAQLKPNEGYACRWLDLNDYLSFYPVGPGFQGDSGSPIMSSTGEALGLLQGLGTVDPECGSTNIKGVWLQTALAEAIARGMAVELATWPLLQEGRLPPWPYPPT